MGKKTEKNNEIKGRIIRIRLADGTMISGQININRDHGYDRLSDLVANYREPFLIVYDVMVHLAHTDTPFRRKTLFINKDYIVWAEPDEDQN